MRAIYVRAQNTCARKIRLARETTLQCERLPFQNRSNTCALATTLYNVSVIIVWRAWYAEVQYLKMANWSEEETLKLIELRSEDNLAPRELGSLEGA